MAKSNFISNVILFGFIIFLFFLLFYLPEILGFDNYKQKAREGTFSNSSEKLSKNIFSILNPSKDKKTKREAPENPRTLKVDKDNYLYSLSPLQRLNVLMDSGYVEYLSHNSNPNAEREFMDHVSNFVPKDEVNWEMFSKPEYKTEILTVIQKSEKLYSVLNEFNPESKEVLNSFIFSIKELLDNSNHSRDILDYLDQISFLDKTVSSTLIQENSSDDIINSWQKIRTSYLIQDAKPDIYKDSLKGIFNPQLKIEEVTLSLNKATKLETFNKSPVLVDVKFSYQDSPNLSIQLIHKDQEKNKKISGKKSKLNPKRKEIQLRKLKINGIYSIYITNPKNQKFIKNYHFASKANLYKWENRKEDKFINSIKFKSKNDLEVDSFFAINNFSNPFLEQF